MQVLLIGSDPENPGWLDGRLADAGFSAFRFNTPELALRHPAANRAEAGLIEAGHGASGNPARVEVMRAGGFEQPLMILSAHSDWRDRVDSLDAGADDYLVKPVRSEELVARLHAMIRRSSGRTGSRIETGDFVCDLAANRIWQHGIPLDLTRNEFRLLRIFLLRPDRILSHAEISSLLYPGQPARSVNAIEVQIRRLRLKIGLKQIQTLRGVGYHLALHGDEGRRSKAG